MCFYAILTLYTHCGRNNQTLWSGRQRLAVCESWCERDLRHDDSKLQKLRSVGLIMMREELWCDFLCLLFLSWVVCTLLTLCNFLFSFLCVLSRRNIMKPLLSRDYDHAFLHVIHINIFVNGECQWNKKIKKYLYTLQF